MISKYSNLLASVIWSTIGYLVVFYIAEGGLVGAILAGLAIGIISYFSRTVTDKVIVPFTKKILGAKDEKRS